jgi:hypothetical protein
VFVVIDELQPVYGADCHNGACIIDQLCQFGASKAGVVHWILTGSSSELLSLVTAKMSLPQPDWPQYTKRDLNCSKFVPIEINPPFPASR